MASPDSTSLQHQLREYLRDELAANGGSMYIKSRHITEDLDASAKRIGRAMAALENDPSLPLLLHRRGGNSDGTTWCIERPSADESEL
jgi:hypothetical protein